MLSPGRSQGGGQPVALRTAGVLFDPGGGCFRRSGGKFRRQRTVRLRLGCAPGQLFQSPERGVAIARRRDGGASGFVADRGPGRGRAWGSRRRKRGGGRGARGTPPPPARFRSTGGFRTCFEVSSLAGFS